MSVRESESSVEPETVVTGPEEAAAGASASSDVSESIGASAAESELAGFASGELPTAGLAAAAATIGRDVLTGLQRNLTMSIAVMVTVAISLTLFGAGLLMRSQVETMKGFWYDRVEVSVFLTADVTDAQVSELREKLESAPHVERVYYESKEEAYEHFSEQFRSSPELVSSVSADALPQSFRVKLDNPSNFGAVEAAVGGAAGVDRVLDQRQLFSKFFAVMNGFQAGALVISLVLLAATALLVSNTMRMSAHARRRETGIMRLVGASKAHIQLPFVLEGAFAGFVGGLAAAGALASVMHFYVNGKLRESLTASFTALIGWNDVIPVMLLLIAAGTVLAAVASALSLRRHLKV